MTPLEQALVDLKARVERLELTVRRLAGGELEKAPAGELQDEQQLLDWLKAQGLLRDPTAEERRLAAEWDALSEEEKQSHIQFMQDLVLDPPLSEVIIQNRR